MSDRKLQPGRRKRCSDRPVLGARCMYEDFLWPVFRSYIYMEQCQSDSAIHQRSSEPMAFKGGRPPHFYGPSFGQDCPAPVVLSGNTIACTSSYVLGRLASLAFCTGITLREPCIRRFALRVTLWQYNSLHFELLAASGKPSTWLPLGRFEKQTMCETHHTSYIMISHFWISALS